ncbi:hypothetical protein [Companilactobacillus mishanensis]|uniref:DUF443 family protein n=1 Tax=Companilactobacillus mishanensis TaxID=2486008 RepID=A0A5P0ZKH2_9LACO|nr:hypothetical protein [Companilactobacillus mishanensis]MQS53542.1 hypothetical protein [Companilactobacillus mishanensis]
MKTVIGHMLNFFRLFSRFYFVDDVSKGYRYIYDKRKNKLLVYNLPTGPTKTATNIMSGLSALTVIVIAGSPGIPMILDTTAKLDMRFRSTIFICSMAIGIALIPIFQIWFQSNFEREGIVKGLQPDKKSVLYGIDAFRDQYWMELKGENEKEFVRYFRKNFGLKILFPIILIILAGINMIFYLPATGSVTVVAVILILIISLSAWTAILADRKVRLIGKIIFLKHDDLGD